MRDKSAAVRLLAIDTATTLCGVAVLDLEPQTAGGDIGLGGGQGGVRAAVRRHGVSTHSEMLLPLIAEVLGELASSPRQLSAVVCGAGPGSFTGLRIGIATAKGLCFALGIPLLMVSSLHALGLGALQRSAATRPVLATLNAFRGQVFARLVLPAGYAPEADLQRLLAEHPALLTDAVWAPAALAALLLPCAEQLGLCGGGLTSYPVLRLPGALVVDEDPAPHPLAVLQLGAARLRRGESDALAAASPNYICASAAEENAATGRAVTGGS